MDLDERFGQCRPAARPVAEVEQHIQPRSLQRLADVAAVLKTYLECAGDLAIPAVFHETAPILWLVDEDGAIRIAMEEVVLRDTGALRYILPRNGPPMEAHHVRLGHPALLDPVEPGMVKEARIGGELFYDPVRYSPVSWVISNNSGRYGKREGITRSHINNVRDVFASYDIQVRPFFIEWRG
ncbi:hypothetical protein M2360_004595 [Rhizobium sp. SG_E_25_P2]|uniref:hypothetical protein n=1 Tax=Rhizobium sp. SG_E_25_P2 TaxID=2879942 RepID=UPI00247551DB|nr:hypothetical protein [Rhizobium sp. SG_E_25_P2]MDH6269169.1 hypothetical protein [Rhizobium sp. SG_E_25_P2]